MKMKHKIEVMLNELKNKRNSSQKSLTAGYSKKLPCRAIKWLNEIKMEPLHIHGRCHKLDTEFK